MLGELEEGKTYNILGEFKYHSPIINQLTPLITIIFIFGLYLILY